VRAFGGRSLFFVLLLVLSFAAACGGDSDERQFAEAISAQNQRWVETGERPLADLVLRLANQPTTIVDRRADVVASLDALISLNGEVLAATEGLRPPSERALACHEAQLSRVRDERNWVGQLRTAIGQTADASAVAMLATFRDLAPAITKADEACSTFIDRVN